MIIGMVDLDRDHQLRPQTIGYQDRYILRVPVEQKRNAGVRCQTMGQWAVQYGSQIVRDSTQAVPLVKLVEHYIFDKRDMYVERLCYSTPRGVIPYRIKQITPYNSQWYNGIHNVGLIKNIEHIHRLLGNRTTLETPIAMFVKDVIPGIKSGLSDEHKNVIRETYLKHQAVLDTMVTDDASWISSLHRLCDYDRDRSGPNDWCIDDYVITHLSPTLGFYDEITARTFSGGMSYREVEAAAKRRLVYVDLSPVKPLQVDMSEAVTSPPQARELVECLNNIGYTDICLEYILLNNSPVEVINDIRYDRYRRDLHTEHETGRIRELIDVALSTTIDILADRGYATPLLYTEIHFRLIKTFGEEALLEIYDQATKDHVLTIHLDLALLALCTLGAIQTA